MVNYCKLCGADLTPTKELKLMTWEDFVKKTKKYGYKEHINVFGDGSVWKGVKRGKYSNGEDIIAYSPIFTKEGKILFSFSISLLR